MVYYTGSDSDYDFLYITIGPDPYPFDRPPDALNVGLDMLYKISRNEIVLKKRFPVKADESQWAQYNRETAVEQ